ncbi:indole-3-glycerol phosphate synthase TrpC [Zhihengliuella flava]|uniref:Indole-3-glycerol phosphate synthase n=1 Tax=Zhihengliuella flava TaxID=1285193 RepID=A0A931DFC0_9MICC|nr:indole-3-glycerol phosphate synthase [Zhihengliuella flava]
MSVLDDIIGGVREDLAARRVAVPDADIQAAARAAAPARNAWAALGGVTGDVQRDTRLHVISEVKRKSPSKGALAEIPAPAELARRYADGGASVISVLTEQRRFGGSLEDFDAVRSAVDVPLLRKDFMVEDYQIFEARAHGADLILLIVAALSDEDLRRMLAVARELGMEALVEAHTEEEIDRAVAIGATIIGVNVRNLKTLDVDRGTFARLASRIPSDVVIVAESGVRSVEDVVDFATQGADAILVGEALVKDAMPRDTVAAFVSAGSAAKPARR